jgi:hypothetical protein
LEFSTPDLQFPTLFFAVAKNKLTLLELITHVWHPIVALNGHQFGVALIFSRANAFAAVQAESHYYLAESLRIDILLTSC